MGGSGVKGGEVGIDQKELDRLKEIEKRYGGQPADATWSHIYDPKTMALTGDIEGKLSGINTDKRGMEKFRTEALRTGRSPWAGMARTGQDMEAARAMDQGARGVAGQNATARAGLAMRGGLTGGARERLAAAGTDSFLDMGQNVAGQTAQNKLNIDMNDESNRIQQLGMLPGLENQAIQPDLEKTKLYGQARQLDIGNQLQDNQSHNAFDMGMYGEKMKAWAAGKQADATLDAGKK